MSDESEADDKDEQTAEVRPPRPDGYTLVENCDSSEESESTTPKKKDDSGDS